MKYRLKKDLPTLKAGAIFSDEDNEEMSWGRNLYYTDENGVLYRFYTKNIDNFDEWFEEVKEPEWVRKQIKRIEFRIPDGKNWSNNDYVEITWRYIKDYYYMDSEWGIAMCYKKGLTSREAVENVDGCDDVGSQSRAEADKRLINLANQLVRDGYIEIKDNPNIVWEDEKCD